MECHWALGMAHYFAVWTAEGIADDSLLGNDVGAPQGIADGMPLGFRDGSLLGCVDG